MTAADKTLTVDRERVLAALRAKREEIERRYGLRMVGIVGSVARGEAGPESDIDVMVDIVRPPSLFRLVGAEQDVEDAVGLGLRVEFLIRDDVRPALRARMERDFVPL